MRRSLSARSPNEYYDSRLTSRLSAYCTFWSVSLLFLNVRARHMLYIFTSSA